MKQTQLFRFALMTNFLTSFLFGCKTTKEGVSIFPYIQTSPSDTEIIFPYNKNNKTGLYKLNLNNSTVTEFLPPHDGVIANPILSRDKDKLFLSYAKKESGIYKEYIALISLKDSTFKHIAEINKVLVDIIPSSDSDKLYLILAYEVDKSSPISNYKPKSVNIYTYSLTDNSIQEEIDLNAYTISGKSFLDASGQNLYLNITFNKISNLQNPSGPYKLNIKTKELTYLAPVNIADLHPGVDMRGVTKDFYTNNLQPMPSINPDKYFLKGVYDLYEVDANNHIGKIIFEQNSKERFDKHFTLRGIAPFNNKDSIIIVRQSDLGDQFVIISNNKVVGIHNIDANSLSKNF